MVPSDLVIMRSDVGVGFITPRLRVFTLSQQIFVPELDAVDSVSFDQTFVIHRFFAFEIADLSDFLAFLSLSVVDLVVLCILQKSPYFSPKSEKISSLYLE